MALADYFNKNVQAASSVIQGFDESALRAALERVHIAIAFDGAATTVKEGQATLDLLVRLLARLYPSLLLLPLDTVASRKKESMAKLARAINPKIDIDSTHSATHSIVVGSSRSEVMGGALTFYVGSDNWLAKVSDSAPVGSGNSYNPFGAGVAACIGAANLFKAVFSDELDSPRIDQNVVFSALDFEIETRKTRDLPFKNVVLGDACLVGAGAVGNGFLWALLRGGVKGAITVVDHEDLELGNVQRYVMTAVRDVGNKKAQLAKEWFDNTGLSIAAECSTWEQYVERRNNWNIKAVAVAVDNADARIHIQSALPEAIFNAWTQGSEAGVSRHGFDGEDACLACLYMPRRQRPNFDEIVLAALKVPNDRPNLMEVRTRLDTGQPTEREYLERISRSANVALERLLPFEGRPLRELYIQAVCGGAVMEFNSTGTSAMADVPMAFQSALAGVLLAADLVAETSRLRPRLPPITQIDLLSRFPVFPTTQRKKDPELRCICKDEDFLDRYRAKYRTTRRQQRVRTGQKVRRLRVA